MKRNVIENSSLMITREIIILIRVEAFDCRLSRDVQKSRNVF